MDAIATLDITPYGPFGEPIPIFQRRKFSRAVYNYGGDKKQSLLFFSAGSTAAFTSSLYNGLDCLRVRWQVSSTADPKGSLVEFASGIIKTEGFVNGLWRPGIVANAIGMGASGALRFGYYEIVRDALHDDDGGGKNGIKMAMAGLSCGAFAYFVTTPFHLLKTMIQAEKGLIGPNGLYLTGQRAGKAPYVTGLFSGMKRVVSENGIRGLWRGCVPLTARGATFTGGQLAGYDGFKTICKSYGVEDGPKLHAIAGVVAAASATLTATPADYTMSRFMSSHETSVAVIVKQIYKEGGIAGFWKGSTINFCRSTPVFLTYTAVYEQLRRHFGLGYF